MTHAPRTLRGASQSRRRLAKCPMEEPTGTRLRPDRPFEAHFSHPQQAAASTAAPTLRYAPLLWLALGTFAVGTESFMIAAILPAIARDLGVGVAATGQL